MGNWQLFLFSLFVDIQKIEWRLSSLLFIFYQTLCEKNLSVNMGLYDKCIKEPFIDGRLK